MFFPGFGRAHRLLTCFGWGLPVVWPGSPGGTRELAPNILQTRGVDIFAWQSELDSQITLGFDFIRPAPLKTCVRLSLIYIYIVCVCLCV